MKQAAKKKKANKNCVEYRKKKQHIFVYNFAQWKSQVSMMMKSQQSVYVYIFVYYFQRNKRTIDGI